MVGEEDGVVKNLEKVRSVLAKFIDLMSNKLPYALPSM
jgi:hypothetical protein